MKNTLKDLLVAIINNEAGYKYDNNDKHLNTNENVPTLSCYGLYDSYKKHFYIIDKDVIFRKRKYTKSKETFTCYRNFRFKFVDGEPDLVFNNKLDCIETIITENYFVSEIRCDYKPTYKLQMGTIEQELTEQETNDFMVMLDTRYKHT